MPGYELTRDMEMAVLRQVLADPSLLPRLSRHLHPEWFAHEGVRLAVDLARSYHQRIGSVPTRVALINEVQALVNAGKKYSVQEFAALLETASEANPVETNYVLERIFSVERHEAMHAAVDEVMKHNRAREYERSLRALEKAYAVGRVDSAPGTDFRRGLLERTERRRTKGPVPRWGMGIPEVDDLIVGLAPGELGTILGITKGGKSQALGHIGMYVMATGGFAVYVSTEMSEEALVDRQDAAVSRVPIHDLHREPEVVARAVAAWFARVRGGMKIKKLPKGCTTRDIEAYLDVLRLEEGIEPDVVLIDYADEMDPVDPRRYDKRHEELVAVHQELRDMAEKRETRVWTASQARVTEALESKNPTIASMAGATGKAFIDDLVLALCRTPEEKVDGWIRFFVAACRFSGDGMQTDALATGFPLGRLILECPWLDPER